MTLTTKQKTPVYYISHGGPEFMYMKDFAAFKIVERMGKEILHVKPKGIVAISAHWEVDANTIYVNTAEHTELIYDFANRPAYMYQEKFPNIGSKEISRRILQLLEDNQIKAIETTRGLDHGIWCSFKIAFSEKSPLENTPIVQISLYKNNDANLHIDLGRALAPLRNEGIVIVTSGMSVHNLNERYDYPNGLIASYTKPFDDALVEAMTKHVGDSRRQALNALLRRDDIRLAHPTFEHLFPIYVAAGVAYDDPCELLYTSYQGSFAWGQYRLGVAPKS